MSDSIRVVVADDHRLFTEGLDLVLSRDGIQVVGTAATGRQTVELTSDLKPDIVLINTMFANAITPGVEALHNAGIPVVVLSSPLGKGVKMDCWVSGDQREITREQAETYYKLDERSEEGS